MKNILYVLLMLSIPIIRMNAQQGSPASGTTVTGQVIDKSTGQPMDAATVSVTDSRTGNVFAGTMTNSKGEFRISNIPFGVYNIDVNFISYDKASVDSITLGNNQPVRSLGKIFLSPSGISLGEVSVVADKPVIENKADKIVYNVAEDITSQGALAVDVLRKVPQVTVDADGNVELQGSSNVRFLINGKTSSVFGSNLADALASIPASQIKSIEAITNPGAKYDLQGSGGIINIILKENKLQGVSGNINLSAGTRNENGSVNLGVKRGNFGINGYFSGNWRVPSDGSTSNSRQTTDTITGVSSSLLQNGLSRFERKGYRAGAGFEWNITKGLDLTGTAGYNSFAFNSSGLIDQHESITDPGGSMISGISSLRNFKNRRETGSADWNLDLKKSFPKEGHALDIVVNSSYGRPVSFYSQALMRINDSGPLGGSESNNPGTDNNTEISADYAFPIDSTTSLEAGVKGTFRNINSNADVNVFDPASGQFVFDPVQSYHLGYNLDIYAAYLSFGFRLFKWLDLKAGARYEYSGISISYPGASVPSYGTFVPSIVLSHSFKQDKSMQLSYSRRINRPDYNELNPFINRSDPYNIETGNLLLKPEISDRIELSYNTGVLKGGNLKITLSERINSHQIEDFTTFYPVYMVGDSVYRNVSVRTFENIGSEYNTGLNLFGSVPVTPKLTLRGNLMLFHTFITDNPDVGNLSTGFRFRGNLNATWQLPRKLSLEFFGFWRSAGRDIQGREPQFYIYNFALRKLFWNDNGSFGLTATNIFRRDIKQVRTITTANSVSTNIRELPFRSFGVSFTYKFGKMHEKQNRENESDTFNGEQ